jgi:hypothetical protein
MSSCRWKCYIEIVPTLEANSKIIMPRQCLIFVNCKLLEILEVGILNFAR